MRRTSRRSWRRAAVDFGSCEPDVADQRQALATGVVDSSPGEYRAGAWVGLGGLGSDRDVGSVARRAKPIARPMPRLAPVMNSVFREATCGETRPSQYCSGSSRRRAVGSIGRLISRASARRDAHHGTDAERPEAIATPTKPGLRAWSRRTRTR